MSVEDTLRMTLHDLQVHQVELETQNEELRRTQLLLDESTARYFDLYDLAPVGYCSLSEAGIITEENLAVTTMLGVEREAIRGKKISRFVMRDYQDTYYLFWQTSFKSKKSQSCDVKMMSEDGFQIWVNLVSNLTCDVHGSPLLRLVMTDVTDRKLMATAMEASESRYRAMVDWSPEAILVHRQGKILYANQAAVELLGARFAHDIVNTSVTDWVRADFHDAASARWQLSTELFVSTPMVEQVIVRASGEQRDVEVRSLTTMFKDEIAIQVVVRDVTERKRMEALLRVTAQELQASKTIADQANAAKSDFLSSLGHDLRTPLHSMIGYAQLLETGTPELLGSQMESLKQVLEAGWYLLKLINELLDLASIEAGQFSISMQAVAIEPLLVECESMLSPQAKQRDVTMIDRTGDSHLCVIGDPTRLKQVICNLLSNAIKYNRQGGTIHISCEPSGDSNIRLSISDTGQGLSPDQILQLFQPFKRLENAVGYEEGTGIGLVVTQRLIGLMNGKIGVESTVGVGSTFWIDLPQVDSSALKV
jgi:PAS domain S-box-containing protein